MWADRYRKWHANSEVLEFRKWRRHEKRQWSTDVSVSAGARERLAGFPEKIRPIVGPAINRLHYSFIEPFYTPAYGRLFTSWFVKLPLVTFLGYSFYQALKTGRNAMSELPDDVKPRMRQAGRALFRTERYTEEHMKDFLEYRYPRKL